MASKTIAIDFDGVVHMYPTGWNKGIINGDIIPGVAESLQELKDMGYHVMIYSTRTNPTYRKPGEPIQKLQMQEYLEKHKIPYDSIFEGKGKPMFEVTVDDRAIGFRGDWKQTIQDIKDFKVWNRPGAKSSSELNHNSNGE